MNVYYKKIMQDSDSVGEKFKSKWREYVFSLKESYNNAIQLRIGSHLRPFLVIWGYALGNKREHVQFDSKLLDLAICVELLHKTSVIIDDYIDEDIARHNKLAFHKQFSGEETIIFAFYLIGTIFKKINSLNFDNSNQKESMIRIFADTLKGMSYGCLDELVLDNITRYDHSIIKSIIKLETSTLIKNSLLLGYLYNNGTNKNAIEVISNIGYQIGNLFQVMNDLEPFCSLKNVNAHKGSFNIDFNKSRKNVVVTYIYGMSTLKEQSRLENIGCDEESIAYLFKLYDKYNIYNHLMEDIDKTQNNIEKHLNELIDYEIDSAWVEGFTTFYQEVLQIAKSRLLKRY